MLPLYHHVPPTLISTYVMVCGHSRHTYFQVWFGFTIYTHAVQICKGFFAIQE